MHRGVFFFYTEKKKKKRHDRVSFLTDDSKRHIATNQCTCPALQRSTPSTISPSLQRRRKITSPGIPYMA
jgi:hypothetical protein